MCGHIEYLEHTYVLCLAFIGHKTSSVSSFLDFCALQCFAMCFALAVYTVHWPCECKNNFQLWVQLSCSRTPFAICGYWLVWVEQPSYCGVAAVCLLFVGFEAPATHFTLQCDPQSLGKMWSTTFFEILLSQHALGCLLYKLFFAGFVSEGKHFYKIPTRLLGHSPFAVIAEFWPVSIFCKSQIWLQRLGVFVSINIFLWLVHKASIIVD